MTTRWMPGEVSTRAGGPMTRLTSLPRRQAVAWSVSAVARMGTWPGIAAAGGLAHKMRQLCEGYA